MILTFAVGIKYGLSAGLFVSLVFGLSSGIIGCLTTILSKTEIAEEAIFSEKGTLLLGLISGLTFVVIDGLAFVTLARLNSIEIDNLYEWLIFRLIWGLTGGLVIGLIARFITRLKDIRFEEKLFFSWRSALNSGLILGFFSGLTSWLIHALVFWLNVGISIAILSRLPEIFMSDHVFDDSSIHLIKKMSVSFILIEGLRSGLGFGVRLGLVLGLIGGLFGGLKDVEFIGKSFFGQGTLQSGLVFGSVFGLSLWPQSLLSLSNRFDEMLSVGLGTGLISALIGVIIGDLNIIKIVEKIKFSLRKVLQSGLIFGIIVGVIDGLVLGRIDGLVSGMSTGLIFGLSTGLITSESEVNEKYFPNQGIKRSLKASLIGGLTTGLAVGLVGEVSVGLIGEIIFGLSPWLLLVKYKMVSRLILGLSSGLIGGFIGGFIGGL